MAKGSGLVWPVMWIAYFRKRVEIDGGEEVVNWDRRDGGMRFLLARK